MGVMGKRADPKIGDTQGQYTLLELDVGKTSHDKRIHLWKCSCGKEKPMPQGSPSKHCRSCYKAKSRKLYADIRINTDPPELSYKSYPIPRSDERVKKPLIAERSAERYRRKKILEKKEEEGQS